MTMQRGVLLAALAVGIAWVWRRRTLPAPARPTEFRYIYPSTWYPTETNSTHDDTPAFTVTATN